MFRMSQMKWGPSQYQVRPLTNCPEWSKLFQWHSFRKIRAVSFPRPNKMDFQGGDTLAFVIPSSLILPNFAVFLTFHIVFWNWETQAVRSHTISPNHHIERSYCGKFWRPPKVVGLISESVDGHLTLLRTGLGYIEAKHKKMFWRDGGQHGRHL